MSQTAPLSMTAFAARRGQGEGDLAAWSWVWDMRSVNGKGLDLRLRVPDFVEGLEAAVRAEAGRRLSRGNVSINLKLSRAQGAETFRVNEAALATAISALSQVQAAALEAGLVLSPTTAGDVLSVRGVTEAAVSDDSDTAALLAPLMADFHALLADFNAMRASEGAALRAVLLAQIDAIEALTLEARTAAEARRPRQAEILQDNVRRLLGATEADPARLAQELALLAVKADITEETDRLSAHIAAARALLAQAAPVGRKFDFLAQEFNREANTLCSKSGDITLTRIGLDLKHLIDQMREQVQNLE